MDTELQQLKDIHLPQAISQWPIAPGWIALYLVLVATVSYAAYWLYKRRRKKSLIKFALLQLNQLQNELIENPGKANIAAEISLLIRRTALYYFPREKIAGVAGREWLNFLNQSGNTDLFTKEVGRLLTDAPYQKNNDIDLIPLFDLTRAWLKTISKKNGLPAER